MSLPKELITVTPLSKTIALILFILLPFVGFSLGLNYQKQIDDIQQGNTVQHISTPTPTVQYVSQEHPDWNAFIGKSSYSQQLGKFVLFIPSTCKLVIGKNYPQKTLSCMYNNSLITINPEAGGRDAVVVKNDSVVINNIKWLRAYFDKNNTALGVSYELDTPSPGQLLEIDYQNYSIQAQNYVETIIATFKLL